MRLINADALIEKIKKDSWFFDNSAKYRPIYNDRGVIELLEDQPTVDAEPVRHGHWIIYVISPYDGEDVKCSECGEHSCMPTWDYCPNCGAKMDEEVEHEAY